MFFSGEPSPVQQHLTIFDYWLIYEEDLWNHFLDLSQSSLLHKAWKVYMKYPQDKRNSHLAPHKTNWSGNQYISRELDHFEMNSKIFSWWRHCSFNCSVVMLIKHPPNLITFPDLSSTYFAPLCLNSHPSISCLMSFHYYHYFCMKFCERWSILSFCYKFQSRSLNYSQSDDPMILWSLDWN
jgi:hypothetical protein